MATNEIRIDLPGSEKGSCYVNAYSVPSFDTNWYTVKRRIRSKFTLKLLAFQARSQMFRNGCMHPCPSVTSAKQALNALDAKMATIVMACGDKSSSVFLFGNHL